MAVEGYGKGYRYRFRYSDPATGEKRWASKAGYALKRDAKAAEEDARRLTIGLGIVPQSKAATVSAWLEEFNESARITRDENTASLYALQATAWVIPRIGGLKITAVTKADIERLERDLLTAGKRCRRCETCRLASSSRRRHLGVAVRPCQSPVPMAPTTVQGVHRYPVTAFGEAVARGYIAKSPMAGLRRPHADKVRKLVWTPDQAVQFLDYVKTDRLKALWLLVLSTGMRRGEVAGLPWEGVHSASAMVHIYTQRKVTLDYRVIEGNPKSEKSTRMVPLQPIALSALGDWKQLQAQELRAANVYEAPRYVFTDVAGAPLHPQAITLLVKGLQKKAGVPIIPLHNLRHTVATMLLAAGIHPKVVQELLGHSSIQVTLDMYSQVPQESLRAATGTLSGILSAPVDNPLELPVGVAE